MARRKKSYRRSRGSSSMNWKKIAVSGAIYGALRAKVANLATPLTNMVPLGQYSDEAVLGVIDYMLAKKGKGYIKSVGEAGLIIEVARIADGIVSSGFNISSSNGSSSMLNTQSVF